MDSLQPQPMYFHSDIQKPRTFLELEDNKKYVSIYHPHLQYRFPLPTKDEISKDYKNLNSFFIFRTYLHKSNNHLDLEDISTIASVAWECATEDVKEACRELETELKKNDKYKKFLPYSPQTPKPKRPKTNKSPSKKKYSPPMATPHISGAPYTPASPMCMSEAQCAMPPPLTIGPSVMPLPQKPKQTSTSMFSRNSNMEVQLSSVSSPRLTPSQIFLTSAIPCTSSSELSDIIPSTSNEIEHEVISMGVQTTTNSLSPEDEEICINELFGDQINEMRSPNVMT